MQPAPVLYLPLSDPVIQHLITKKIKINNNNIIYIYIHTNFKTNWYFNEKVLKKLKNWKKLKKYAIYSTVHLPVCIFTQMCHFSFILSWALQHIEHSIKQMRIFYSCSCITYSTTPHKSQITNSRYNKSWKETRDQGASQKPQLEFHKGREKSSKSQRDDPAQHYRVNSNHDRHRQHKGDMQMDPRSQHFVVHLSHLSLRCRLCLGGRTRERDRDGES